MKKLFVVLGSIVGIIILIFLLIPKGYLRYGLTMLPFHTNTVKTLEGIVPAVSLSPDDETLMTKGAIVVTAIGNSIESAKGDGRTDDSRAFSEAIRIASEESQKQYQNGPHGPQGVVYVPAGAYRIRDVLLRDNVRIEVNAGALFLQTPGSTTTYSYSLFIVGTQGTDVPTAPLRNVSIVGIGKSNTMGGIPKPTIPGWDTSKTFAINFDPKATGASQFLKPIRVMYVDGFLLKNILGIANNSDPKNILPGGTNAESSTIWMQNQTTQGGSQYVGPSNGTIDTILTLHAPSGYGAVQLQSGRSLTFNNIFSDGGIALRLESGLVAADTLIANGCERIQNGGGSRGGKTCNCTNTNQCSLRYFSEINGITGNNIECRNGVAAVSLLSHNQTNKNVRIDGVRATNCFTGISAGGPGDPRVTPEGTFRSISLSNINVTAGESSQGLPAPSGAGSWKETHSLAPICALDASILEPITITNCTKSGTFQGITNKCDQSITMQCK